MNPALTISPEDGSIHIAGCSLVIGRRLTAANAAVPLAQFYRSELDHKNGYAWRMYQGVSLESQSSGFALCFHFGRLTEVHIGASVPNIRLENGWPTRESIEHEVAFLKESFKRQLSRSFETGQEQFAWGSAWTQVDAKGFLASAGVRYAKS